MRRELHRPERAIPAPLLSGCERHRLHGRHGFLDLGGSVGAAKGSGDARSARGARRRARAGDQQRHGPGGTGSARRTGCGGDRTATRRGGCIRACFVGIPLERTHEPTGRRGAGTRAHELLRSSNDRVPASDRATTGLASAIRRPALLPAKPGRSTAAPRLALEPAWIGLLIGWALRAGAGPLVRRGGGGARAVLRRFAARRPGSHGRGERDAARLGFPGVMSGKSPAFSCHHGGGATVSIRRSSEWGFSAGSRAKRGQLEGKERLADAVPTRTPATGFPCEKVEMRIRVALLIVLLANGLWSVGAPACPTELEEPEAHSHGVLDAATHPHGSGGDAAGLDPVSGRDARRGLAGAPDESPGCCRTDTLTPVLAQAKMGWQPIGQLSLAVMLAPTLHPPQAAVLPGSARLRLGQPPPLPYARSRRPLVI